MARKSKVKNYIYAILALFLLALTIISGQGNLPAFADTLTPTYSDVLEDLQRDSNFKASDYPDNPIDYSIKVIQVAEGVRDEIFIYTYQPSQKTTPVIATDVNMAVQNSVGFTKLYSLMLINTNGVFGKYIVDGRKTVSASVRTYNITSIYRAWDKKLDGETGNDNTGEKKAFAVNNVYCAKTENGEIKYFCEPTRVVRIEDPYSDFLLYTNSSSLPPMPSLQYSFQQLGFMDGHYVAFSTDLRIDKLKSATVTYSTRSAVGNVTEKYLWVPAKVDVTYGTIETKYSYPTYQDKAEVTGSSWSGYKHNYSWDRIQTLNEFITSEPKLTDETKEKLKGKQWVLRFLETKRTQKERSILGVKKYEITWTEVKNVSVLMLEFETDGKVYNFGAVCDAVSGDDKPGNVEPKPEELSFWDRVGQFFERLWNKLKGLEWWQWLLIVLGIILFCGLIFSVITFGIKAVIDLVLHLILSALKLLWWLFCLPFKLIAKLFGLGGE